MGVGAWSYLSLLVLAILAVTEGYRKYKNRLLFVHYFAVSGAILFFDYLVYAWGKAYKYDPGIIEGKFDTHIGALINAQILPAFTILYIALRFKWYWSVVFAAFFTGIELLFKHLGIYKSFWWQEWYTFVLLCLLFPIAKYWWVRLSRKPLKWLSFLSILSNYYVVFTQLNVILYGVLKWRTIHVEWIERLDRDSSNINSPTAILFGIMITSLLMVKARRKWYVVAMIVYLCFDAVLKYFGIIRTNHLVLESILSLAMFLIPILFAKYARNKLNEIENNLN